MPNSIQTIVVSSVLLFSATSCVAQTGSQAQADQEAEEILAEWLGEPSISTEMMRQYRALARRDCNEGQGMTGYEFGACRAVELALAEEELAAAERAYEAGIDRLSDYVSEPDATYLEGRWRSVWQYGQRHWRQTRDADCVGLGISAGGGSGTGASVTKCRTDRTLERAAQVRAM